MSLILDSNKPQITKYSSDLSASFAIPQPYRYFSSKYSNKSRIRFCSLRSSCRTDDSHNPNSSIQWTASSPCIAAAKGSVTACMSLMLRLPPTVVSLFENYAMTTQNRPRRLPYTCFMKYCFDFGRLRTDIFYPKWVVAFEIVNWLQSGNVQDCLLAEMLLFALT
jgi:hypothetical protein